MLRMSLRFTAVALVFSVAVFSAAAPAHAQPTRARFRLEETTIAHVHAAFRTRVLTCHALVSKYLERIAAYDKRGAGH